MAISSKKRFLADGLAVVLALFAYYLFPLDAKLNGVVQSVVLGIAFFGLLPAIYVRLVRKEPLSAIGLGPSARRFGWLAIPLAALPMLAFLYFLTRQYPVEDGYYLPSLVMSSFPMFLLYEVILVGAFMFLYEVFFRGFIQLLWLGRFGLWSVFFQFAIFAIFLFLTDGITWQSAPLLVAAAASGFIASYTRSIYYSWAAGWLVVFLADAYFLMLK